MTIDQTTAAVHFHAGNNDPGYLPDELPATFATWDQARRYIIGELLRDADSVASWNEPHDCEDCPCPVYGDNCPESKASDLTNVAEELNLDNGPDWSTITAGRSYWIHSCSCAMGAAELEDEPEPEARARSIAGDWHSGQASALYAFSSSGTILPELAGEVRTCRGEVLAHVGNYTQDDIRDLLYLGDFLDTAAPAPALPDLAELEARALARKPRPEAPKMTRAHFVFLADLIAHLWPDDESDGRSPSSREGRLRRPETTNTEYVAECFADALAGSNPRFGRDRFIAAATVR